MSWDEVAPLFRPPPALEGQLGTFRSVMVFADGTPVKTATDWPRRRAEILAEWHGVMGEWPPLLAKVPMETLSETHRETFTQRRVRLEVAPGQRIEGWLLVPDGVTAGAARTPAVLVPFYEPETSVGLGRAPAARLRAAADAGRLRHAVDRHAGRATRAVPTAASSRRSRCPTTRMSPPTPGRRWPACRTSTPTASAWSATAMAASGRCSPARSGTGSRPSRPATRASSSTRRDPTSTTGSRGTSASIRRCGARSAGCRRPTTRAPGRTR